MVRIDTLILIMRHEADVLSCESDIRKRVRERINRSQREYFLREEIKVIQDELGEGGSDTDEYFERIMGAELPAEVQKKLLRALHSTIDDAMDAAGLPLLGVVPEDSDVPYALNRGIPLRDINYYAARAYENIARRITGHQVPLMRI